MKTLVLNAVQAILDEARFYLQRTSAEAFSMPLTVYAGATIGQHTRHYIEFFQCLAESLEAAKPVADVVLDYDLRRRDKLVETEPRHALNVIDSLAARLQVIKHSGKMWLNYTDYATGVTTLLPTSLERELHYNIEHTIHHFALIKIGLNLISPCLKLPDGFGVAPSTIHRSPALAGQN